MCSLFVNYTIIKLCNFKVESPGDITIPLLSKAFITNMNFLKNSTLYSGLFEGKQIDTISFKSKRDNTIKLSLFSQQ